MGIERFFASLYSNYDIISDIVYPYKKINCNHLFFDFNSIIHIVSKESFTSEEDLINKVCNFIYNFLKNNVNFKALKTIMLALDGVPSKSKMMEQKHRRFMGEVVKLLLDKNDKWSKNNISPGTTFMHNLSLKLNSSIFKKNIFSICTNLENLIIDDIYQFNEGEKKIVDFINKKEFFNQEIVIYSPDADMILLGMLLANKNNIRIYRHDQQRSNEHHFYNLIKINDLVNLINLEISTKLKYFNFEFKLDRIIKDIVLIFTIFGDDFLPKIESVDVRSDIDLIFNIYSLTLGRIKEYLILNDKNKYEINFVFFKKFSKSLTKLEKSLTNIIALRKKYHNFKRYNGNNFKIDTSLFYKYVKYKSNEQIKSLVLNSPKSYIFDNFLYNVISNLDLIKFFDFFANKKNKYKQFDIYFLKPEDLLDKLIKYVKVNGKLPLIINHDNKKINNLRYNKKLELYSTNSKSKYHQSNLKDLNKNEKKEYILNNQLDDYHKKFNINKKPIKNEIDLEYQYLKGIEWILNYYYNNINNELLWYYPYENVPTIKELYQYIKTQNSKFLKYQFQKVDNLKNYFTVLEQLLFITPYSAKYIENYKGNLRNYFYLFEKFFNDEQINQIRLFIISKKMRNYYFDIKEIILKTSFNEIDCTNAIFFNKCKLKKLEELKLNKLNFISEFRKYISLKDQLKIYPMIYE